MRTRMNKPAEKAEMRGRLSRQKGMQGFALMDVAVGAAVLGMIVIGTLSIFSFGQRQITNRVAERSAYDLARTRIEEVIADGYEDALARVDTGLVVYNDIPAVRTTIVTFVDDAADSLAPSDPDPNDFKNIEVVVEYGAQGQTKTVSIETIFVP